MKKTWMVCSLLSVAASAQQAPLPGAPATEPRTFISAAEIAEVIAKADAQSAAGKAFNGGPLLVSGPDRGMLQYLTAPMKMYAQHEDEDELFVVLDGSGTMVLGARLVDPRRGTGATTLVADSGVGGVAHKLAKGDMFLVPMKTSRSVTEVNGKLVMMSMRLPHPGAADANGAGH